VITAENRASFFTDYAPYRLGVKPKPAESIAALGPAYHEGLAAYAKFTSQYDGSIPAKRRIQKIVEKDKAWIGFFSSRCKATLIHYYNQTIDDRTCETAETRNGWCLGATSTWLHRRVRGRDIFPAEFYASDAPCAATARKIMDYQTKVLAHKDLLPEHVRMAAGGKPALDYIYGKPGVGPLLYKPLNWMSDELGKRYADVPHLISTFPVDASTNPLMLVALYFHEYSGGGAHAIALDRSRGELFDPNIGVIRVNSGKSIDLCNFLVHNLLNQFYVHSKPPGMLTREPYNKNLTLLRVFQVRVKEVEK
jgi:hypothetical protein